MPEARKSVLLIGCGYWGRNIARALHAEGALAGICDPNQQMASAIAHELGAKLIADPKEFLDNPSIDAVAIAAPAALHAGLAQQALLAGKHVFVEKPIALDVSEAGELRDVARQQNKILMVGHLLQYHPAFLKLQSLIRQGLIGRLYYIYSNRLNIGKVRREENVLWSFAPHDISMVLALAGAPPTHVEAQGHCYLNKSVADMTVTHLQFADGLGAHIFVSWLHPFKEQKLVVVGDRGMLVFEDTVPWGRKLLLYQHAVNWSEGLPVAVKGEGEAIPVEPEEPLGLEMRHFLRCITDQATPRTDAEEAIAVLDVLNRAEQSLRLALRRDPIPAPKPEPAAANYFVHESAAVDPGVQIGKGTRIWHFTHVLSNSRVGAECSIGQNCSIGPDVTIGNGCKLQNNVSVYKGVTLEDDVFCGPSCVFTNVLTPRAHVERKDEFRPTIVGRGATIGANATIVCGNSVGRYAMVGAGAVVTKDVPDFALVVGNPARQIGWVSETGERLQDDLRCPRTGTQYRLRDGKLEPAPETATVI